MDLNVLLIFASRLYQTQSVIKLLCSKIEIHVALIYV